MKVVGNPQRYSKTPGPQEAWRRGVALDASLPKLPRPDMGWPKVQRLSHAEMNRQDDALAVERARLVNNAPRLAEAQLER
jgi:hypothetical protein